MNVKTESSQSQFVIEDVNHHKNKSTSQLILFESESTKSFDFNLTKLIIKKINKNKED